MTKSVLDTLDGVGPGAQETAADGVRLGARDRNASVDEIAAVKGMTAAWRRR